MSAKKTKKKSAAVSMPCFHARLAFLLDGIETEEEIAVVLEKIFELDHGVVHAYASGLVEGVDSALDEDKPIEDVDAQGLAFARRVVAEMIASRRSDDEPSQEECNAVVGKIAAHAAAVGHGDEPAHGGRVLH